MSWKIQIYHKFTILCLRGWEWRRLQRPQDCLQCIPGPSFSVHKPRLLPLCNSMLTLTRLMLSTKLKWRKAWHFAWIMDVFLYLTRPYFFSYSAFSVAAANAAVKMRIIPSFISILMCLKLQCWLKTGICIHHHFQLSIMWFSHSQSLCQDIWPADSKPVPKQ